ncbi:MAG: hypothetical protein KDM64_12485 [Verrucomicrobiae bacterium]|nr:hypothetical protein [Verrucomicrobiae bacterium]
MGLPGDLEAIFEPFHTTKDQGLGMGLAICRTILTHLGGKLWAEAGTEGGSVFHLSLPAEEPTE